MEITVSGQVDAFIVALSEDLNDRDTIESFRCDGDSIYTALRKHVNTRLEWVADARAALDTNGFRALYRALVAKYGEGEGLKRRVAVMRYEVSKLDGRALTSRDGNHNAILWVSALVLAILWTARADLEESYREEEKRERYRDAYCGARIGGASCGDALWIAQDAA